MNIEKEKQEEQLCTLVINREEYTKEENSPNFISLIERYFRNIGFVEKKEGEIFKGMRISNMDEESQENKLNREKILVIEGNYNDVNNNNYFQLRITTKKGIPAEYRYVEYKDIAGLSEEAYRDEYVSDRENIYVFNKMKGITEAVIEEIEYLN